VSGTVTASNRDRKDVRDQAQAQAQERRQCCMGFFWGPAGMPWLVCVRKGAYPDTAYAYLIGSMFTPRALKTLSPIQYRMCSTSLVHPDQIFSKSVPYQPPWPKPTSLPSSLTWTASSSLQWKESKVDDKTVARLLTRLQRALRSVHKRKVTWPIEESTSSKYV